MLPVTLAFGASVAWGASDFLGGLASRRMPVAAVLFWAQLAGLTLAAAAWLVAGAPVPGARVALLGGAAGLAELAGFAFLYRGLAIGEMSSVAPLAALTAVLPVGVAVGAGERVAALEAAGMVLAVAGSAMAAGDPDRRRAARGAGLGLAAAACFGIFLLALGEAGESGGHAAVVAGRLSSVLVLGTFVAARGSRPRGPAPRQGRARARGARRARRPGEPGLRPRGGGRRDRRRGRARLALPADHRAARPHAPARAARRGPRGGDRRGLRRRGAHRRLRGLSP